MKGTIVRQGRSQRTNQMQATSESHKTHTQKGKKLTEDPLYRVGRDANAGVRYRNLKHILGPVQANLDRDGPAGTKFACIGQEVVEDLRNLVGIAFDDW